MAPRSPRALCPCGRCARLVHLVDLVGGQCEECRRGQTSIFEFLDPVLDDRAAGR